MIDPQDLSVESRAAVSHLRAILDHAFEFIGILDVTGKLLEINVSALTFAGISREQVIGQSFVDTPWWR